MKKNLKKYLPFYLGCRVQTKIRRSAGAYKPMKILTGKLMEVDLGMGEKVGILLEDEKDITNYEYYSYNNIKPFLRPLSNMSHLEFEEIFESKFSDNYYKSVVRMMAKSQFELFQKLSTHGGSHAFIKLCEAGFDIFGLIEAGLAIKEIKHHGKEN